VGRSETLKLTWERRVGQSIKLDNSFLKNYKLAQRLRSVRLDKFKAIRKSS